MIRSVTDKVLNQESQALAKAIMSQANDLCHDVVIEENPNSGWIYAADDWSGKCYLFSDNDNKVLEEHISCPNCGYENFITNYVDEMPDNDCCQEYGIELDLLEVVEEEWDQDAEDEQRAEIQKDIEQEERSILESVEFIKELSDEIMRK